MTGARDSAKRRFVDAAGWRGAVLSPLAGDASNRRYERVRARDGARAVLMDAPMERGEDIGLFLAFTGGLRDLGLSAPEVYAADLEAGLALIEDLGDDLFARACAREPALEPPLYQAAVDLLVTLRRSPPPLVVSGSGAEARVRPYDYATLLREAALALEWWLDGAAGSPASSDLVAEYEALIAEACAAVETDRSVLVLRDYHAENLLWLPDRVGDARVGLLDYQDALLGAPAYDLMSLLEDARRDTPEALQTAMIDRYLERTGDDADAFRAAYAALGAQRNLKIIGIFARLGLRDGKPHYLDLLPRVWGHLQRDLSHPNLASLARFVEERLPAPTRMTIARVAAACRERARA